MAVLENGPGTKSKEMLVTEISLYARQKSGSESPEPHCTLLTALMVHSARAGPE